MNVLMVSHMPWRQDLGGSRIQLELADELTSMGHNVEKFSLEEAFPHGVLRRLPGQGALFARRAERFIRSQAHRFDVIDAHQGTVTASKQSLGFGGRLVIRSVGLVHFYETWARSVSPVDRSFRRRLGALVRRAEFVLLRRATERSFDAADRIILPNRDELMFVSVNEKWRAKAQEVPNAMTMATWSSLSSIARVAPRVGSGRVVFLGAWGTRKGSRDWANIVAEVWKRQALVTFLFAGTGVDEAQVYSDLRLLDDRRISVVPHFDPSELRALLSESDVGAFPSYIEGLPIGVLEQLAAGIGVVAYDTPGARHLLRSLNKNLLVKPGDDVAMAERIVSVLNMDKDEFDELASACRELASKHTWATVARQTLETYGIADKDAE